MCFSWKTRAGHMELAPLLGRTWLELTRCWLLRWGMFLTTPPFKQSVTPRPPPLLHDLPTWLLKAFGFAVLDNNNKARIRLKEKKRGCPAFLNPSLQSELTVQVTWQVYNYQELHLFPEKNEANGTDPTWCVRGLNCIISAQHACVLNHFSHVQLFVTLWTIAHQAPLSMGFSRQEYRSGLPFPTPGNLPYPRIGPMSFVSPALACGFCTTSTTWEA